MAEGGMAAALGNVDDRDNWKVHFADTMRGGQYLNNWRMAELHAKEAPDRVRELEAWGAVFDRTKDGRILQRNFGGHRYPRLAHVGDRTGLEMIRTLQDHGIHQGIDVHMEYTIVDAAQGRRPRRRARSATTASAAASRVFKAKAVVLATGGIGRAFKITSNSWEYTGDGQALAYDAGAELIDMEFVQFHPTGMVWPPTRARHPGHRRRARRRRRPAQQGRQALHVRRHPGELQSADGGQRGRRLALHAGRQERAAAAGAADARSRGALHHARSARRGAAARTAASSSTSRGSRRSSRTRAEHIKKKLPSMYHQFKQLADLDITKEPMEVGPTTHYMMGGVRVDGDTQMSTVPGLFAAGECAAGLHGANRLGGNSLSDLLVFGKRAGEYAAKFAKENGARAGRRRRRSTRRAQGALAPFERGAAGENPFTVQHELQDMMQELVGIVRSEGEMQQALDEHRRAAGSARRSVGVDGQPRVQPGLAHGARSATTC